MHQSKNAHKSRKVMRCTLVFIPFAGRVQQNYAPKQRMEWLGSIWPAKREHVNGFAKEKEQIPIAHKLLAL
jgi:hypothetical protein